MVPISLVICGLLNSRFEESGGISSLQNAYRIIKSLNSKNEIVISTYEGEVTKEIYQSSDKVVLNRDPGCDKFKVHPWPIGKKETRSSTNYSRIFETTINGISHCSNEIVIRTRIEILPTNLQEFKVWISECIEKLLKTDLPKIGFFTEHYNGIYFSVDGTLGTIPNTLQIGRKQTLLDTWTDSQKFWQNNFELLTRPTIKFPVSDEQIVGLNYLKLYCKFPLMDELNKIKRYYSSKRLVKSIMIAEQGFIVWSSYATSGFTKNKFKGTAMITIPKENNGATKYYLRNLLIVVVKRYKHMLRRMITGLVFTYKLRSNKFLVHGQLSYLRRKIER